MKINFYYKTDPKLKIAIDNITGEGAEAYLKVTIDQENKLNKEEYSTCHEAFRKVLGNQLKEDFNLIYPISEKEYFENNDDDEKEITG